VVQGRQRHLLEIVGALEASRGLPGALDGGEQKPDEDPDDRDDDKQFNEGKPGFVRGVGVHERLFLSCYVFYATAALAAGA